MSEISSVCEKIIVINKGKIVADNSLENILTMLGSQNRINLRIEGDGEKILGLFYIPCPVSKKAVSPKSGCYTVAGSLTDDTRREIFNKMAENGCPILLMENKNFHLRKCS